jgi:hypothetical protein
MLRQVPLNCGHMMIIEATGGLFHFNFAKKQPENTGKTAREQN